MPLREFADRRGNTWRVWETRPTSTNVRPERRAGWLTFEHGDVRRRLTPIPEGWAERSDLELRRMWADAFEERPRMPPRG